MGENKDIGKILDELFSSMEVRDEEKARISADLKEAIFLNFVYRIFELLPERSKKEFSEEFLDNPKRLIKFVEEQVPNLQTQNVFRAAIKEVLDKYTKK